MHVTSNGAVYMLMGTLGFLVLGYLLAVLIEVPILCMGFGRKYPISETIINGLLLTAVTYPVVIMVLPSLFQAAGSHNRLLYLAIAETFAPVAEVFFFRYLTNRPVIGKPDWEAIVIVAANVASFLIGEAGLSRWLSTAVGNP